MIFMVKGNISENIEEYLEVLYKYGSRIKPVSTTTISKQLSIAPGSVTQMLKKLEDLGYISYVPYKGALLTEDGMKIAQQITRKHRILEIFLKEVLKIKDENVHLQACEMEHSLSDEAERSLCHMLNQPDLCPDEHIVPACSFDFESCKDCIDDKHDFEEIGIRDSNLLSLSQLHGGEEGKVNFIRGDSSLLANIISLGIAIGTDIKKNNEESTFIINNNEEILSLELMNNIFVKVS